MADRKHWAKYRENSTPHAQWLQQSLNSFRGQFMEFVERAQTHSESRKSSTDRSTLSSKESTVQYIYETIEDKKKKNFLPITGNESNPLDEKLNNEQQTPLLVGHEARKPSVPSLRNFVLEQFSTLMTTCIIIRIHDFTIYKVTTSTQKPTTKEFVTGKFIELINKQFNNNYYCIYTKSATSIFFATKHGVADLTNYIN